MMTPFARLATTLTLSLGIALSPITAAPARADSDADKLLAILLGLAVVGTIIDDRRDRRVVVDRPHRPNRKALPARCLKRFETRDGTKRFWGARCLERHYPRAHRLPARCEVTIKTRNHHGDRVRRDVFKPHCLRREGYTVAGRR